MNDARTVYVIVEGQTDQQFIKEVLAPFLAMKGVFLYAALLRKPGESGGDVKFDRAQDDIGRFLKQRDDTCVTLMVDYYGIDTDWPGYADSKRQLDHTQKHAVLMQHTVDKIKCLFPEQRPETRFVPYFSMHEIEALYFSDIHKLAEGLGVKEAEVEKIVKECGGPEKINDSPMTAPSKRLERLSATFRKTSTGIAIAKDIGIPAMRSACPLFDAWVSRLESGGAA
jgi:hypothetical protein